MVDRLSSFSKNATVLVLWMTWTTPLLAQTTPPLTDAPPAADLPVRDPNGPSADGLHWFDVEVTVFKSVYDELPDRELAVSHKLTLRYLPQLRELADPFDIYRFDFALAPTEETVALGAEASLQQVTSVPLVVVNQEGPAVPLSGMSAFKLLDYERDPFIAVSGRANHFGQINNRLQASGKHEVLWHRQWRQPLRARGQVSSLFVSGGQAYGEHHELEGSIRVSGQGRDATLDVNLWLARFESSLQPATAEWVLPALPNLEPAATPSQTQAGPSTEPTLAATTWHPSEIWQLSQTRNINANSLYYLDHPTLGLLVEIRPYLVPELELPPTEQVALPVSGFE